MAWLNFLALCTANAMVGDSDGLNDGEYRLISLHSVQLFFINSLGLCSLCFSYSTFIVTAGGGFIPEGFSTGRDSVYIIYV